VLGGLLLVVAPLLVGADGDGERFSMRVGDSASAGLPPALLPSAPSVESALEQLFPSVVVLIPESGAFSRIDPQKLSILGDSWLWTRWSLNGLDITDPFFDGAAALHVPLGFLSDLAVEYNEDPRNTRGAGVHLTSAFDDPRPGLRAGVRAFLPGLGGALPFATKGPPIAPEDDRRRLAGVNVDLYLLDSRDLGSFRLKSAVEVIRGERLFNQFDPAQAAFAGQFAEHFLIVSGGALLEPRSRDFTAILLAEYRQRDHLFDELYFAPNETARQEAATLVFGFTAPSLKAGATFKTFSIQAVDPGFTRELLDLDGEGTHPWYPSGSYVAGSANATWRRSIAYLAANIDLVSFDPSSERWSNPLTFQGNPYGRIDWTSARSLEVRGHERLGIHDVLKSERFTLAYDIYAFNTYGANDTGRNSLALFDFGFSTDFTASLSDSLTGFANLSRTPIPVSSQLVQVLDPNYSNGRQYLGASTLLDTFGGNSIRVAPNLLGTAVYTLAVGTRLALGECWRLTGQLMLKRYQDTYWIGFDGPASAYGRTVDGIFYDDPGPKRYVLEDYHLDNASKPIFTGAQLQLSLVGQRSYLFDVGLNAFNTVGVPPLGNGPTSNDLGLADWSTANPNALIHGWSDFGGDRGFVVKGMAGWEILSGLWALVSTRFYDGEPFAFYDVHTFDGQVAFTMASRRASPYKFPPLEGTRKEFQVNIDVKVQYAAEFRGHAFTASLVGTNLFDLGHEIAEAFSDNARPSRQPLELQIPRTLIASIEAPL
jgi:hypothetical protein